MFGKLFKRRTAPEPTKPAPAPGPATGTSIDVVFPHTLFSMLFKHLSEKGRFHGALQGADGFTTQTMPENMEVCVNRDRFVGALLDPQIAAVSFGGMDLMTLSVVCASGFFKHTHGVEPDWEPGKDENGAGQLTAVIPIGDAFLIDVKCTAGEVDPFFQGETMQGASILIQVKAA